MNPKIMVIDDDDRLLSLYEATLKSQGYRVTTASDGEQGLARVIQEKPDLVLLDIMMPKVHGINVLDILKATPDTKDIKIIILTAISDEKTKEKALFLGADDFIVKAESSITDILDRIQKVLGRN